MPSDFFEGRSQPKTLADLIEQLERHGASEGREPFATSAMPTSKVFRPRKPRKKTNKETEEERRRRLAREALKTLEK